MAFLGSQAEADRNEFHFPPTHPACARGALERWAADRPSALGHQQAPEQWSVVTTSGFEYVRPSREDADRRAVFAPNSVVS